MAEMDATDAILARHAAGTISPETALMELLIACEDATQVRRIASTAQAHALVRLLDANAEGCARIASMLASGVDSSEPLKTTEEGIAFCKRLFDWSVQQSEEASVALYSLGNPEILAKATREIVDLLERWGVLGSSRAVLDIGCGIGRIESAIAPRVKEVHGIDVSAKMIDAARRRCVGLANVTFAECTGKDLAAYADARFDMVSAVDSFPYLVQSGMDLVRLYFSEAARVLSPRGDLVILNFSYRDGDVDGDDVRDLAAKNNFDVLVLGTRPFSLWQGSAFHLRKR